MQRYQYQPGNGTNYDIMYGDNGPGRGYLFVWLKRGGSGGSAFRFDGGCFIHSGYLMEKMDLPERLMGDVWALCAFLNAQGHQAEVGGYFDGNGQYIRPNMVELRAE
jgi:hypothetical protein